MQDSIYCVCLLNIHAPLGRCENGLSTDLGTTYLVLFLNVPCGERKD